MQQLDTQFDLTHLWHPYTSMTKPVPTYPVVSAAGTKITLEDGTELIDAMASWWSVIHGYNHPVINQAINEQVNKVSHVMFGGLTHQPAIDLGKLLVELTPEPLNKVFLADSGSVSVEVALKMAIQYQLGKQRTGRNKFVALRRGYHGDTFGAMAVCDPDNSMHSLYKGILPEHFFVSTGNSKPNDEFDNNDLIELKQTIEQHSQSIAALIIEPVVQGAGGMRFYHPEFVKQAKLLCEEHDILLIADEIATGFGRTGKMFAVEHADICPDIMCVGKAITGGYVSLAATLCTEHVGNTISQSEAGVLMHGPTFMGNPLACAAAIASLTLLKQGLWQQQVTYIERQLMNALLPLNNLESVAEARVFGAIGVVEMKSAVDVAEVQRQFIKQGVWVRPFGKNIYVMPHYTTKEDELTSITAAMVKVIELL